MRYLLTFSLLLLLGQSIQAQQITPQKISGRWVLRKMAEAGQTVDLDHKNPASGLDYKKAAVIFDKTFLNFQPNGTWTARIPKELTGRSWVDGGTYSFNVDKTQLLMKSLDTEGNVSTVTARLAKDGSLVISVGQPSDSLVFRRPK